MKSKIVAVLVLGITLFGGVQAKAATIDNGTSRNRLLSYRYHRPSGGGGNTIINDKYIAQVEQAIYNKVNEERSKAAVAQLSYNSAMERYARIKSQDMGDNNYFNHEDLSGNLIINKMRADGVSYTAWGENIAYIGGVTNPIELASQFMTNWMNSEGHRENILSKDFSSIGVGVYKVGNKVYATQEFHK